MILISRKFIGFAECSFRSTALILTVEVKRSQVLAVPTVDILEFQEQKARRSVTELNH